MKEERFVENTRGKKIISSAQLAEILKDRDRRILRIEQVTEVMQKLNNARTDEEYKSISIPDEFRKFGKYAIFAMKGYVSGFAMADNDGTPRCYYGNMGSLTELLMPTLYRGELSDFGPTSGLSLLGRKIAMEHQDEEARYTHFFLEQINRLLFGNFLLLFRQYREFPFGMPIDGAIAQHYGLNTQFLDLTDDIKVALFFASCKHTENNKYRPIRADEIDHLGKYGVIYVGTHKHASIIGYQPFTRCHRQRGYYLDTAGGSPCWNFGLTPENGFDKYYFERTVEFSEWICKEFDGGKKLFPEDGLYPFHKEIRKIMDTKILPYGAVQMAYQAVRRYLEYYHDNKHMNNRLYNMMQDQTYWEEQLRKEGYEFCDRFHLDVERVLINQLNDQWDPVKFAQQEGIYYTPFTIIPAVDG